MKALNLKNVSWSLIVSAMMCMITFAGCSDDDEEGMKIEFPELQEETHAAGEKITISFNAATDWQLTSKASWCKFVNGDFKETTTQGKAGKQTVEAEILDEAQDYINDNVAEIVLKMDDKEQVIYKITRSKKVFAGLSIKSVPETEGEEVKEYNAENPILVKGCDIDTDRDGYLLINASVEDANLTVGIKDGNYPDWLKLEKVDNGFKLFFNRQNKENLDPKYSIGKEKGGNIKFSVTTSDQTIISEVEIPVTYEGLKEGAILVEPAYSNLTVSVDGKTFTEIATGMETGSVDLKTYENELVSTITVRDDKFHVLIGSAIQKDALGAKVYEYDFTKSPDWVSMEQKGTEITVEAAALGNVTEQRGAIVLVLPETVWEKVKEEGLNETLIEEEGWGEYSYHVIKDAYSKGVMATLIQEPEKQVGGKINLTAFYAQDIQDWNTVTEDDLTPIEMIGGMLMPDVKDMLIDNLGMSADDIVGEEVWALSVPNFIKGASYCIQVDNLPQGCMLGMTDNKWGDENVQWHEETIAGKRYIVLTALVGDIAPLSVPVSIVGGNPETGEMPVECFIMLY